MADITLSEDPMSTVGNTPAYKAAWQEKYGKTAEEVAAEAPALELDEDPESTRGASEEYKAAWHKQYGNAEPAGNASKADWVAYAVLQGASEEEAEAMTATDLKDAYSGAGPVSAPAQTSDPVSTADADKASGQAAPGAGVNSGTPGGSASTTGTSSAGAQAKSGN